MSSAYREAAGVLEVVLSRKRGLRAAALAPHVKNKRKVLALVTRTVENQAHIERAIAETKGAAKKIAAAVPNRAMRLLMLYDLLLGSGKISGGGKASRACKELKGPLAKILEPIAAAHRAALAAEAIGGKNGPPRYVRVNPVRAQGGLDEEIQDLRQHIAETLRAHRQQQSHAGESKLPESHETEQEARDLVRVDPHVSNLLVCASVKGLEFHNHPKVLNGSWILQDKASCFSAEALAGPDSGYRCRGDVLDACAAPGNKTTHAAALLHVAHREAQLAAQLAACRVFAMDRDPVRLGTLRRRAALAGCCTPDDSDAAAAVAAVGRKQGKKKRKAQPGGGPDSPSEASGGSTELVVTECGDFLQADPQAPKFANLRAILLDPSCSGSGITDSLDRLVDRVAEREERTKATGKSNGGNERCDTSKIDGLVRFQKAALAKAMSFPQVERVVYSTCSIHDQENELVVASALGKAEDESPGNAAEADEKEFLDPPSKFELVPCLPQWPRRGRVVGGLGSSEAECLVRCDPSADATHGFFVACFDRVAPKSNSDGAEGASRLKRAREDENALLNLKPISALGDSGELSRKKVKVSKYEKRRQKQQRRQEREREGGG